ncbi:2-oxo acid dehydrogenase subunit E2 [Sphingobium sufflavum]|uniref:dihydrolipoamide acetyltransferase family protein n=1 Tax=Sphingobium sufflavum TaxID=1129547 RepID=UPI001F40BF0A|nr:dihydrolipoamide acetyltransferase family protein [Sphingobium sufflavum]MCE7795550.1 2-oxo acid dehydrogenase subunit E2 [Sphingobium sufflavum]
MARFTFRLPDIGEGIATAEIVAWHVRPGDRVAEDQRLADMMTDKATIEMESPVAGSIIELAGEPGDRVAIGATLAVIDMEEDNGTADAVSVSLPSERAERPTTPSSIPPEDEGDPSTDSERKDTEDKAPNEARRKILASPAVRARARDLGIDLAQVQAEGEHIRHADLDAFLRYGREQGYASATGAARPDEHVRVIGLRRRIADAMAESKRNIPHFSYVEEIDVTALEGMRVQLNAHRGELPKLTLLPLLITAICRTVPDFAMMNARYNDVAGIVTRHGAVHMGVATQTAGGLLVPVIREAQSRNIWQLAAEIARLAETARSGKATSAELSGSTLTISSLGALGGIASTPVINRPEVAIIAPNRIVERPVLDGEDIRRALVMNLSISCDHRVVDGWDAASFVQAIKRLLEAPALLLAP